MAATITIDPDVSFQTIKGWEAVAQAGHDYNATTDTYPEYPSTTWAQYKDDLIAGTVTEGINRLRWEVFLSNVNTGGSYNGGPNANAIQPSTAVEGDWVYEDGEQAGIELILTVKAALQAQGEDLYVVLCVVDNRNGGYDAENTPSEYAFFVNKMVTKMEELVGIVPNAIEVILEPDWSQNTTNWTAAKVANNLVAARNLLISNGYTGLDWIAPSMKRAQDAVTWYNDMVTAQPTIASILTELSYHDYDAPNDSDLQAIAAAAEADGVATSMVENITENIHQVYRHLKHAHAAAIQQYTLTFPYPSATDNGEAYFQVNTTTWAVTVGTRTKYLRHLFKYVRQGAVMKEVTDSSASYTGLAFENTNGTYAAIVLCAAAQDLTIVGLPPGTYEIRYTTGDGVTAPSAYNQVITSQVIDTGEDVVFNMPGAGIVSIFDTNYLDPVSPTEGITYHAAPDGLSSNDGLTEGSAWDLRTALTNPAWNVLDRLHIHGTPETPYLGKFVSSLAVAGIVADEDKPIVMPAPGENPVIDGNATTLLVGAIDDTTQTVIVVSTEGMISGSSILVDEECMQISSVDDATTLTVNRGWGNPDQTGPTIAAAHSDGTTVYLSGASNFSVVSGTNTRYIGLSVHNSAGLRNEITDFATRAIGVGIGVTGTADRNDFINFDIRDCGNGIFIGSSTSNTLVYGNNVLNNGILDHASDTSGMGIYAENASGYSKVYRNTFLNSANFNAQFGGDGGPYTGGDHQYNVFAGAGRPWGTSNINYLGRAEGEDLYVAYNHFFQPHASTGGGAALLGFGSAISLLTLLANRFVGGGVSCDFRAVTAILGSLNHFFKKGTGSNLGVIFYTPGTYGVPTGTFDSNTYHGTQGLTHWVKGGTGQVNFAQWKTDMGFDAASSETNVDMPDVAVVIPNEYETGRANVVIYATSDPVDIDIDLATTGLTDGQNYSVYNAFDPDTSIYDSVYDAGNTVIALPLADMEGVAAPAGMTAPATMAPDLAVLLIRPGEIVGQAVETIAVNSGARFNSGVHR